MDLAKTLGEVVRIANDGRDPHRSWHLLTDYLASQLSVSPSHDLSAVNIAADISSVRTQIDEVVRAEPPPPAIKVIYFGLFDALDEHENEVVGYYVSGVERFDEADPDCLCHPAWWPKGRYLSSRALDAVKQAERRAKAEGRCDDQAALGYGGQLGAALLVSRYSSEGIFPGLGRVVGFDEGDIAEVID